MATVKQPEPRRQARVHVPVIRGDGDRWSDSRGSL
jgi:hypothetical protein